MGRKLSSGRRRVPWLLTALVLSIQGQAAKAASDPIRIPIVYVTRGYPAPQPPSRVDISPANAGLAGARLGIAEINTAGAFLGYRFELQSVNLDAGQSPDDALRKSKIVIADLKAEDLKKLAALPAAEGALILDMRTRTDRLRQEDCRANTFHLLPSNAMRTDALAQYLIFKRWKKWFLLKGTGPEDPEYAADIERSAKRYGARIVDTRTYAYSGGARRVDTGYQQIQSQMPLATADVAEHDIVFLADTRDAFGDYLPYETTSPRPVVGTQGLVATAWSAAFQEYSALQMQARFERAYKRPMLEADYGGWLAARIVGEAVIRSRRVEAKALAGFVRSPDFSVAAFKGQALTFRPWDQQLRQPVPLSTSKMVVSMSPQDAFLHPGYLTDSLGFDAPETKCHL